MNRRTILKGGVVTALASHSTALAPAQTATAAATEQPRDEVRRLARRISELLDQFDDVNCMMIRPKSVGEWAVYAIRDV